jgi:hypothetical protein
MKNYTIIRIGNEYVVQAHEKSVLKIASRRRAERTVTDAAELLDSQPAPPLSQDAPDKPSIARDPGIIPDTGNMPDPGITPDPSEVP